MQVCICIWYIAVATIIICKVMHIVFPVLTSTSKRTLTPPQLTSLFKRVCTEVPRIEQSDWTLLARNISDTVDRLRYVLIKLCHSIYGEPMQQACMHVQCVHVWDNGSE